MNKIPILLPLGNGSTRDNDELRMALRSVEKNAIGLDKVYLITAFKPSWIVESDDLVVVPINDIYSDCKDACLFHKVHETLKRFDIGDFVFMADDNVFLKPMELSKIPVLHNHRPNSLYYAPDATRWRKRVKNTLEWARKRGVELPHTYEAHAPALLDGKKIVESLGTWEYYPDYPNGKTIITTWLVITDSWHNSLNQPDYKWTFELGIDETVTHMSDEELCSKPFLGYCDATADRVLARLAKMFPLKSKYEK